MTEIERKDTSSNDLYTSKYFFFKGTRANIFRVSPQQICNSRDFANKPDFPSLEQLLMHSFILHSFEYVGYPLASFPLTIKIERVRCVIKKKVYP